MTREEYLKTKAEDFMNEKMLTLLAERENKNESDVARVNMKAFLYSIGRIDPFEMICINRRRI